MHGNQGLILILSALIELYGLIARKIYFFNFSLLFLLVTLSVANNVSASEIQVITNTKPSNLIFAKTHIKGIYLGQKTQWPDGSKISVFVLNSDAPTHQNFIRKTLKLYPYQFRRRWEKLTYSGFGVKPTIVKSKEEMLLKISTIEGSIGYIDEKVMRKGVQYVQVD